MLSRKPFNKLRKDVRAISPLIATLLLIAIAVAASVITYSWVMSMIGSQSQQAQTQVRIDLVNWDLTNNKVTVTVRNTGSVPATVEEISVRKNLAGQSWYTDVTDDATGSVVVGGTVDLVWDEAGASATDLLEASESYVIRITCTTGFYYEMISTTPSS
jgi:flagellin-like protein